jgi:hypothetical protein
MVLNQEQVKELLLLIRRSEEPFEVILSGKKSRKVNGLYKPEGRQIILHNRNFQSESELLYTAIHEYAHHLHFSSPEPPRSARSHTTRFWSLFHGLLAEAEERGLYRSPFEEIEEFRALSREIKENIIARNGALMKELGRLLARAEELCEKHHVSYADYIDRILAIPRASAAAMVKSHLLDLDPRVGYENMRLIARVRDPELRLRAQAELLSGKSHDMVKEMISGPAQPADPAGRLRSEKQRLERWIQRLQRRLETVIRELAELEPETGRETHGSHRQR